MAIFDMNVDLEDVIDKIIKKTKKPKKEILERIEEKKEDLGGLITDEGAACIVANELGVEIFEEITYKRKRTQIKDLTAGMNNISVVGRIGSIFPIHEFTRKNGQKGKLVKFVLEDLTGQIQVVLWNEQTRLVTDKKIEVNDIIELKNAYTKAGLGDQIELHLGRQGSINLNPQDIDLTAFENLSSSSSFLKIEQLKARMWNVNLIGRIQWKSGISTFSRQNGIGQVASLNIFDETGQTRVALWDNHASFVEQVNVNDIVKIFNAYTRMGRDNSVEIHIGTRSEIKKEGSLNIDLPESPTNTPSLNEVKIKDLVSVRKNIKVVGKIIELQPPRDVVFKDSSNHQVCDVLFADETGCISLSIWDDTIERIQKGKVYRVENGYVSVFRGNLRLNVGKFGEIIPVNTSIKRINKENNLSEQILEIPRKLIMELKENEIVEIRGTIVSLQEKSPIYNSCPTCNKKINLENGNWTCKKCGIVSNPLLRMLWSFTLDDGTANIRVTVTDEIAEELLGMTTTETKELIEKELIEHYPLILKAKELLGKELIVTGNVRFNSFTSKLDLMANTISYPNPCEELSKLLVKIESSIIS